MLPSIGGRATGDSSLLPTTTSLISNLDECDKTAALALTTETENGKENEIENANCNRFDDDNDSECSLIDWGEENEFTSTYYGTQKPLTKSIENNTVKSCAENLKIENSTTLNPFPFALASKDVITPKAPCEPMEEGKPQPLIKDIQPQSNHQSSMQYYEYEEDDEFDDASFMDAFNLVQENISSNSNLDQKSTTADAGAGAGVGAAVAATAVSVAAAQRMGKKRRGPQTDLERCSSKTVHTDPHKIKAVIAKWETLLKYLGVVMLMELENVPLAYIQAFPRSRKLDWLIVIVNSWWMHEDGFIYGRFQDPTGILDGVVHRDLFTSKLDNITCGSVLLLKDISLFRTSMREQKCYLNITMDNFVTALGLQGENFHPYA